MENSLFRQEAVANRLQRSLGPININIPLSHKITGITVGCILLLLFAFMILATTSEKIVVRGYLDTENGMMSIHSDLSGSVIKLMHKEGDEVKRNEPLMIIGQAEREKSDNQIANLSQQIANFKHQYAIKKNHYQAMQQLHAKKYLSDSQLNEIETELLEISNRIKGIELEKMRLKQARFHLIKAPRDGVVTNILYKEGQSINTSMPLLQILPKNAKLIATLPVPVQHSGFLKNNLEIIVQYDAYPYQRFGSYKAKIKEINLTVLTDEKEDKPIKIGQPYYRIKAELIEPHVYIYGKKTPLSQGMTLSAVLSGDKRSLWQWALDPVYSYYGRSFS